MQNYCKTIGALAAASALVAGTAKAEIEYSINGGYHNEYIWRGIDLGNDMTTAGVDAATEAYGLDISAGLWYASFDAAGDQTSELDIYGEVAKELGVWGLTGAIGYIKYVNDDTSGVVDDAQEVYFGLSKDLGYGISADLTYYWDVETDNEGYTELGFSKSYELTECVSLGLDTRLGYAYEEGDFANWVTTAALDWEFTEDAVLSPYVLYANEGENTTYYENVSTHEFIGGVNLTVSF
ncbi:MAG: TorF family putative porin [Akkermansiaceae bacterium]|nr:TorF family putative porin [Akkermansiaceae bacterium]